MSVVSDPRQVLEKGMNKQKEGGQVGKEGREEPKNQPPAQRPF